MKPSLLKAIRTQWGDCTDCALHMTRTTVVHYDVLPEHSSGYEPPPGGFPDVEIVMVGEGPGDVEDVRGVPFVGEAGQQLRSMITAARQSFSRFPGIALMNVVACKPCEHSGQIRKPSHDEISACQPRLRSLLDAFQPRVVLALGNVAHASLYDWCPFRLVRMIHPSAIIHQQTGGPQWINHLVTIVEQLGYPLTGGAGQ